VSPDVTRVSDLVRRSAQAWPDRIAVQDLTGSTRVTYAELWAAVERGASVLRCSGLAPGDRVLLAAGAGPGWMTGFLSISHAGLVAVPIPVATPAPLARLVATFAGVRAWIGDRSSGALSAALPDVPRFVAGDLGLSPGLKTRPTVTTPTDLKTRPTSPGLKTRPTSADLKTRRTGESDSSATAVLVFTSGSTSRPRAVALSHAALRANLRSVMAVREAEPDEALLSTLPPPHAYELVAGQLAPLAAGARIVYSGVLLPNRIVEAIRTQAITRMLLVPALFEALARDVVDGLITSRVVDVRCRHLPPRDLAARARALAPTAVARLRAAVRERIGSSFRNVTLGGAAADPAWADVLSTAGIDLDIGYGLTEAGPVVAMGRASECPPRSVGQPLPGVEVRIGAADEVLVRTEAAMQGYAGDAPATAAAFEGRWLRTGDRGRLDAAGFLFITGRIKEAMVTSAGETIYPDDIEPYYRSPLFAELAVVPAPGADGNDQPTLVVVPAGAAIDEGTMRRAVAALRAAAPPRLRVSGFIWRTTPLPRSAIGKVRRRALADELRPSALLRAPRAPSRGRPQEVTS
jgi:long-chain acyl-CoA synthetase